MPVIVTTRPMGMVMVSFAVNTPAVKSRVSPGRSGKSSPVSMNSTAATPHTAQEPNQVRRVSGSIHDGPSVGKQVRDHPDSLRGRRPAIVARPRLVRFAQGSAR